jgi:chitinase
LIVCAAAALPLAAAGCGGGGDTGDETPSTVVPAVSQASTAAGTNFLDVVLVQKVTPATVVAALAGLQASRGTRITLSLPVAGVTEGLNEDDVALLRAARAANSP